MSMLNKIRRALAIAIRFHPLLGQLMSIASDRISAIILLCLIVTVGMAGCRTVDFRVGYSPKSTAPNSPQSSVVPQPVAATTGKYRITRTAPRPSRIALPQDGSVAATKVFRLKPRRSREVPVLSRPKVFLAGAYSNAELGEPGSVSLRSFSKNQPAEIDRSPADAAASTRQIDLATSLALVAGQSPQVAFVRERVTEAWARLDAAEALWLPSLRAGLSYNKHEGNLQDVGGRILDVSRGSTFGGLGAQAVGTGSPAVPGLSAQFHLADAIFQPIIAERTVSARQYRAQAVTNDELLRAALAYVELVQAGVRKRIGEETKTELKKLADLTASFAKRGQGTQADADRAQTELQLQTNVVTRAGEAGKVASARLAEVLNLDDGMQLISVEGNVIRVDLVPVNSETAELVTQALTRRPELSENQYLVDAAWNRYKRERYAAFIPNVGLALSYGGFAGGTGDSLSNNRDRFDVDALLYWEVRNFGSGERAARNTAKSRMHQTQYRRMQLTNLVRREVTEAHARLVSAEKQIQQAEASVKSAHDSMSRNFKRIRHGQGLPLEVLQSIQALDAAKRERLNAKAAYNRAQFRLQRAIGWPVNRSPAG